MNCLQPGNTRDGWSSPAGSGVEPDSIAVARFIRRTEIAARPSAVSPVCCSPAPRAERYGSTFMRRGGRPVNGPGGTLGLRRCSFAGRRLSTEAGGADGGLLWQRDDLPVTFSRSERPGGAGVARGGSDERKFGALWRAYFGALARRSPSQAPPGLSRWLGSPNR